MAIFLVLWSYLLTINLRWLQKKNFGHTIAGVQPQTEVVIKQAWLEGIKPVLVLNKIDRLITEKKLSSLDAHMTLVQVLEAVNAVIGNLFAADVMKENEDNLESGLDDADDSDLYFRCEIFGFFSYRSLKTRGKCIGFAQFVYILRAVGLLFNFPSKNIQTEQN